MTRAVPRKFSSGVLSLHVPTKMGFSPINTKTFAFYRRKLQACLFVDRNARFGPVPTGIVPGGCVNYHTPCRHGPGRNRRRLGLEQLLKPPEEALKGPLRDFKRQIVLCYLEGTFGWIPRSYWIPTGSERFHFSFSF